MKIQDSTSPLKAVGTFARSRAAIRNPDFNFSGCFADFQRRGASCAGAVIQGDSRDSYLSLLFLSFANATMCLGNTDATFLCASARRFFFMKKKKKEEEMLTLVGKYLNLNFVNFMHKRQGQTNRSTACIENSIVFSRYLVFA